MLCRNNVPSETIMKATKFNAPLLFELLGEEKKLCFVFQGEQIGELRYRDSRANTDARSNSYFCGFTINQPANDWPTAKYAAVFESVCSYTGAQVFDISRNCDGWQPPYVFDFDSGFRTKRFALIDDCLNDKLRRK